MTNLLLIDFSAIAHATWHIVANDPDPNACSIKTVERVRGLATGQPYAAICADSKKSLRREQDPTYKANRKAEDRAPLYHQMAVALDVLRGDGFPIWEVEGYEADDIIAAAVKQALATADTTVTIASSDKDLLCLVGERVTAKSLKDGSIIDADAVKAKFGVAPVQMPDYLALVGDASDNIKGAKGIGDKPAAKLLEKYQTLEAMHASWTTDRSQFTPAIAESLGEFWSRVDDVRAMIRLRDAIAIPFEEIAVERVPKVEPMQPVSAEDLMDIMPDTPVETAAPAAAEAPKEQTHTHDFNRWVVTEKRWYCLCGASQQPPAEAAYVPPTALVPQVVDAVYERQLEPRTLDEAVKLAKFVFDSRLFSAYGTPQGVLTTIMAGREMGLSAMAALRGLHIIDGKPVLSSGLIMALVLRSGRAKYFRCTERTAERATFTTQRGDDPPMSLTFTVAEARLAWPKDEAAWNKSGWGKNPADMLVARASSKLARLVYPDVVFSTYGEGEIE